MDGFKPFALGKNSCPPHPTGNCPVKHVKRKLLSTLCQNKNALYRYRNVYVSKNYEVVCT